MEIFSTEFEQALAASPLLALALAYAGGLLASLTPCVYPMLPITAGIIGRANVGGSKLRALGLSCIHVFGMASTYAALGVFAAASGHIFGSLASNPSGFPLH